LPRVCWNKPFKDRRSTGGISSVERILESGTSERRRLLIFQILYSAEWDKRYERTTSWRLMVKRRLE
jgi:hypothetical protein